MGITKTWYKDTLIINLDGFCFYKKYRSDWRRGGVLFVYC